MGITVVADVHSSGTIETDIATIQQDGTHGVDFQTARTTQFQIDEFCTKKEKGRGGCEWLGGNRDDVNGLQSLNVRRSAWVTSMTSDTNSLILTVLVAEG